MWSRVVQGMTILAIPASLYAAGCANGGSLDDGDAGFSSGSSGFVQRFQRQLRKQRKLWLERVERQLWQQLRFVERQLERKQLGSAGRAAPAAAAPAGRAAARRERLQRKLGQQRKLLRQRAEARAAAEAPDPSGSGSRAAALGRRVHLHADNQNKCAAADNGA